MGVACVPSESRCTAFKDGRDLETTDYNTFWSRRACRLPIAPLEVPLVNVIGQMHVRVALIAEDPSSVFVLEDDSQVIAILKKKRCKDTVAVHPFVCESHAFANRAAEVRFDGVDGHGAPSVSKSPD